jgi:hypothetical protein
MSRRWELGLGELSERCRRAGQRAGRHAMITDVMLTQGATLLATIQLNCTAPHIQVVDDLPWPVAYFRAIEDQNIIWMKRSAAESGHSCADGNFIPILLDQWQRGSNASMSTSVRSLPAKVCRRTASVNY